MPDNTNTALNAQGLFSTIGKAFKTAVDSRRREATNKANAQQAARALQVKAELRRKK